jgi:glycosyltransferase involved in cell wall biosynthesis
VIKESTQAFRVLQIIDDASVGGGQIHVLLLSKYLQDMNIEVMIATESVGWLVDQANKLDIPIYSIDISNKVRWRAFKSMYHLLNFQNFDVIHTHGGTAGFWGRLGGQILERKPKIIHSYHGLHYLNIFQGNGIKQRLKNAIFKTIDKLILNITDQIICVCLSDYEKAISAKVATPSKTSIINYGIEVDKFSQPFDKSASRKIFDIASDEFIFGNVGRLHEQKGHRYLLEAFAKVSDRARLLIIGDGDLREELVSLAERLQISDRVIFLGARSDVYEFLSAIDVFVLPSLWEGQPIALLEALAMSKPCIVSDVDGIPEVITNQVNGYLVPPRDIEQLSNIMDLAIRHPDILHNIAKAGSRTISEKFLAQNMAKEIANIYITLTH